MKTLLAWLFAGYALFLLLFTLVASHTQLAPKTVEKDIVPTPDFASIDDIPSRKDAFFGFLRPLIDAQNQRLEKQRQALKAVISEFRDHGNLSRKERQQVRRWAEQYDVEQKPVAEQLSVLERRINTIPASMVLAQAASESAWGTSRFARKANNYFGQWCYRQGCGLVPSQRAPGARHEVARFDTPEASVAAYFHNINTHNAYSELRRLRQQQAQQGKSIAGSELVAGLHRYSERGEAYIEELRSIIRFNELESAPADKDQ